MESFRKFRRLNAVLACLRRHVTYPECAFVVGKHLSRRAGRHVRPTCGWSCDCYHRRPNVRHETNLYLFFFCILFLVCSQPSQKIINRCTCTNYNVHTLQSQHPCPPVCCGMHPTYPGSASSHSLPSATFSKEKKKNEKKITTVTSLLLLLLQHPGCGELPSFHRRHLFCCADQYLRHGFYFCIRTLRWQRGRTCTGKFNAEGVNNVAMLLWYSKQMWRACASAHVYVRALVLHVIFNMCLFRVWRARSVPA